MDNKYIKPIENLSIGKIIEVDGSRIIAELDPTISDLSRVLVKLRRTLLSENFHTPMGSSHCWLYAAV